MNVKLMGGGLEVVVDGMETVLLLVLVLLLGIKVGLLIVLFYMDALYCCSTFWGYVLVEGSDSFFVALLDY